MSTSEYGFHIVNKDPETTYFEFSTSGSAERVMQVAEQILENKYSFESPYKLGQRPPGIEVRSEDPAPLLALKEAREMLENIGNPEAYDLLED